jgi:hypothetical protein
MLLAGFAVYGLGSGLTVAFDVRMYIGRWLRSGADLRRDDGRLTLASGLRDTGRRRHPTLAWEDWRAEVPWMTLYFSVGVWTSLAMALLDWAARA